MKLKSLKIHNIASIADASIDFEGRELRDESLFIICGETGSGKTTILDSICLALYNRTPRLMQASIRESYIESNGESITLANPVQYLRKGTWEACVEFVFESGGKEWKAVWSTHRANRKADGKFQGVTWELIDMSSGTISKGSEAERITGLSFDEFRRTAMLAQGEFTAFLKSKDEEKSAILEKITGTGIYKKIGRIIGESYKEALHACTSRSEAIRAVSENIMDDEVKKKTEAEIITLVQKTEELTEERGVAEGIMKSMEEKSRLKKEIEGFRRALENSASECSRLKGSIAFAEETLKNNENRLAQLDAFLKEVSAHAGMYTQSAVIINELERIEGCDLQISSSKEMALLLSGSLKVLDDSLVGLRNTCKSKEEECKAAEDKLKSLTEEQTAYDADALRKEKEAIVLIRQIEEAEKEEAGLSSKMKTAEELFNETYSLYEKMKESNSQWAKDARAGLRPGDSCPVCRQVIASQDYLDSISDDHFESILRPVAERLSLRQQEKEAAQKLHLENRSRARVLNDRLNALLEGSEIYSDISEDRYTEVTRLLEQCDAAAARTAEVSKQLAELHHQRAQAFQELKNAELDKQKAELKMKEEKRHMEEAEARKTESLDKAKAAITWQRWQEDWDKDRKAFIEKLKSAAAAYHEAAEEHKNLLGLIDRIKDGMTSIRLSYEDIISVMPSFADIPTGEKVRTERLESRLNDLKAGIITSLNGIATSQKALEKHDEICQGLSYETIRRRIEDITPELNTANQRIGSLRKAIEDSEINRKAVMEETKRLKNLEDERDQWKALNDVFGKKDGEYFQKIAQGFIMNDILSKANFYLKSMSGRYILEAQPGTLNILVRDLEQGGTARSTSTISGGESFVISLALALGLSSSGSGRISTDILFIDEGFGSLSEEYLNTVVETLEKLHETSGKKVGIISHIEALRQRINTKIITSKINGSTSKVEIICGSML